jgi:protease I
VKFLKKVAIVVENGFEDIELLYPYYRFKEAGYGVDVVGPKAKEAYEGKHGIPIKSTAAPEDIDLEEYAAIIIPGGHAPDRMRIRLGLVKLVKDANEKGLVVAAICHGAQLLVEADIVRGKRLTCYRSVATDVRNAGGEYVDKMVVVDGNLVTSRFPPDLPAWCRETLKLLKK